MTTGRMERLRALVPVTLRMPGQPGLSIEFLVDTGFTGSLALPPTAIAALHLPYLEEVSANLANDTDVPIHVYAATILWDGGEREVRVLATGRRPLPGTALLAGHEMLARFADGGLVTLDVL